MSEQQEKFDSNTVSNLLKTKGTEKRDHDPRARTEDLVREFRDETGLSIREEIQTAFNRNGEWDGATQHLVIESGGEVVYEEKGMKPVVDKPGKWRAHIKKLTDGVMAGLEATAESERKK